MDNTYKAAATAKISMGPKVGLVVAAVLLLASCVSGSRVLDAVVKANNARNLLALNGKPLKIGFIHPYVPDVSNEGTLGQTLTDINAAYFAIADLGAKVQVVVMGNGCNATAVNGTVETLVKDYKVQGILGPVCSSAVLAAAPLITELGVPSFAYSAFGNAISGVSEYVYRTAPSAALATSPLVDIMREKYKTAIFVRDTGISAKDYTTVAIERYTSTEEGLPGTPGENLGEITFDGANATPEEVTDLVTQALALKPDAVFYMVSFLSTKPELTTAAIEAARSENPELPFLYANALHEETYDALKDADGKAPLLKGILTIETGYSPKTMTRYDNAFGYPVLPNYNIRPETGVYAGVSAIITAARNSGKAEPSAKDIQAVLQKPGFTFKAWGGDVGSFDAETNDLIQTVTVVVMDEYSNLEPYEE